MPKYLYMMKNYIIPMNKNMEVKTMIIGIENLKEKMKDKEDSE